MALALKELATLPLETHTTSMTATDFPQGGSGNAGMQVNVSALNMTLSAGKWLVFAQLSYHSGAAINGICITTAGTASDWVWATPAVPTQVLAFMATGIISLTQPSTVGAAVYGRTGNTIHVESGSLRAIRIG